MPVERYCRFRIRHQNELSGREFTIEVPLCTYVLHIWKIFMLGGLCLFWPKEWEIMNIEANEFRVKWQPADIVIWSPDLAVWNRRKRTKLWKIIKLRTFTHNEFYLLLSKECRSKRFLYSLQNYSVSSATLMYPLDPRLLIISYEGCYVYRFIERLRKKL